MHSLGQPLCRRRFHAGGLRYHGMAPHGQPAGRRRAHRRPDRSTSWNAYEAGVLLARTEGIIPAPETTHAMAAVIEEAKKAKEEGKEKVILFNWSGHGLLDLTRLRQIFCGQH